MALPSEISEELFLLCDTLLEGGEEGMQGIISRMDRAELEAVLGEAVVELVDASERADKEIERFQRRLAERGPKPE
jgi:hypothetical protein